MGYQPVIDSYEEWTGEGWSSRNQILAWGAGAELVIRLKTMGHIAEKMWQEAANDKERVERFDQHHHMNQWLVYKLDEHKEGRDDITAVNILRPWQRSRNHASSDQEEVVVGRASGQLDLLAFSASTQKAKIHTSYMTDGRSVRATSISPSNDPLLAACLSDTALVLYPRWNTDRDTEPISEVSVIPSGKPGRTWSTRFLTHDRLAVGLGPSTEPLHVYDIGPDGISSAPLRKFSTAGADVKLYGDDRVDTNGSTTSGTSSVYPIAPIAASSQAGGREGEIFLSGWYDGAVR